MMREVVKMKKFPIFLILLIFSVPAYATSVYKWGDEKGVVKVPEKGGTDVHYCRDYWKKQLDEATLNYEKFRKELLEEGERLVWHRYGSKTQYQMFTAELPGISERFETYREQMIKAKTMLDKFTNETQKTEDGQRERVVSSVKNEETKTDLLGRGETWWKEKIRPWKEQLKEANQGYEKVSDAFLKQLEKLGPSRWGGLSLTQYQMISSKLTVLDGQMAQYQTEISEAKHTLVRLSKEAKEAGANPAWLE
jgi:predicted  nucleic acid-binding Zn-ribbon protein